MNISRMLDTTLQYLSGAMARIFGPTDDNYPATGVQPFEDKLRKRSRRRD
ncbi:isochorismate synthase [Neosynechococcus sphagnicola]|nr:isochorismate synthase [Neosynechococcus sphagnicola]